MSAFADLLRAHPRLALPVAVYPGLALTGARVRDVVTNPQAQADVQAALRDRYRSPYVLSAMDLSAEAQAFGADVLLSDDEVPSVTGCRVHSLADARALPVPDVGAARTGVYLDAVRRLAALPGRPFVLAGCIGPFSLASRLAGVSETCRYTLTDPDLVHALADKAATFLTAYIRAFRAAGAGAVFMAEPTAGLLSPRGLEAFSSAYVRRIADAVQTDGFAVILHNCAAKLTHLPSILASGAVAHHFGAPMDLATALAQVPPEVILCGNLDPTAVFVQSSPADVTAKVRALRAATQAYCNFILSSGCDIPPSAPLATLDAFHAAASVSSW